MSKSFAEIATTSASYTDLRQLLGTIPGLEALQAEVRLIAQEMPDTVYADPNGCSYRPTEAAPNGCIVGFAVRRLGCTTLDEDSEFQSTAINRVAHYFEPYGLSNGEAYRCENLIEWLDKVQRSQDCEDPWGVAVRRADGGDLS